jgi:hypothetical protein
MPPVPNQSLALLQPGRFTLGCNYWASHAGTEMWRHWQPDTIDADFARLAAHGLTLVRVFPLWPDFQPITQLRGGAGSPVEIRLGEDRLPPGPLGQAGVSEVMVGRLVELCRLAHRHGLQLIIGLVTGWMSGRLFVAPALEGRDPITDPTSLAWQIKFVRALVTATRDESAIGAWDLGNECNCMGTAPSRDAAYLWTATLTNTIRVADPSRPIISGMHSLTAATEGRPNAWTIDDQADLTDVLTTHPYPYWTRHTRQDAVGEFRTSLHATAETRFYADIGGKPCFAEEIGTMGPMVASDAASAVFARINLYSLWANDCRGFLWWCAHDQTHLAAAPYDWIGIETELGLFRVDGSAKPLVEEMQKFSRFLRDLPFPALPRCEPEAVCLLTHGQDDWATAFGAFVLAKQAKLEIQFRHVGQELPPAPIYLVPSLKGPSCVPRHRWLELIERVRAGATLYLSLGDGIVPHFNEVAGVELISRGQRRHDVQAALVDAPDEPFPLPGGDELRFDVRTAEVLAHRVGQAQPVFWRNRLGQGWVYVFAAPLESELTVRPGAFGDTAPAYWKIYEHVRSSQPTRRWLTVAAPHLAVTEHALAHDRRLVVLINHAPQPRSVTLPLPSGVSLARCWRGSGHPTACSNFELKLEAGEAGVLELQRVSSEALTEAGDREQPHLQQRLPVAPGASTT